MSKHCLACGRSGRLDRVGAVKLAVFGTGGTLGFVLLCEAASWVCLKMGERAKRKREAGL